MRRQIRWGSFTILSIRSGLKPPERNLSSCQGLPIHTETEKLSYAKIIFHYRVMLNGELMEEGSTTHGFVNSATFKPVNLKKLMPDFYTALQASVEA